MNTHGRTRHAQFVHKKKNENRFLGHIMYEV